jgi:hypothetical protein
MPKDIYGDGGRLAKVERQGDRADGSTGSCLERSGSFGFRKKASYVAGILVPGVRGVHGWPAFPVQSHVRWRIVPDEFDKMPAALVAGSAAWEGGVYAPV